MIILLSLIAASSYKSINVYEEQSFSGVEWHRAMIRDGWKVFLKEMQEYPLFIPCVLYLLATILRSVFEHNRRLKAK